jgi:hypothetical protein
MESTIKAVDMTDINHLREMADLIGISVSDVFAADHVLWVEGKTEEICFSLIRHKFKIPFPQNTVISSVVSTGDFFSHKRDIELVFQIYERLSKVSLPLVRSVAFNFDRENLTTAEMTDVRRRAKGQVAFLPRRHLECYLVVPSAIAAFANETDLGSEDRHSVEAVEDLLQAKGGQRKYLAQDQWNGDLTDPNWLSEVDAANLISDVLAELTNNRVKFSKVEHSAKLLDHIAKSDAAHITGLIRYLGELASLLNPGTQ